MNIWEKKIIGGISAGFVKPSALNLDSSDFEDSEAGAVFNLAKRLETDGVAIDAEILYLRSADQISAFFTADDFRLMAQTVQSASVVFESAQKIKASALKSYLLSQTSDIALQENHSGVMLLDQLKELVSTAEKFYSTSENSFRSIADLEPEVAGVLKDLYEGISYAVPTYFKNIDYKLLDGFSKGDLHLIVGMTGAGKSALALNFALNQAKRNHRVSYISREMSKDEVIIRLLSMESGIPRYEIRKNMNAEIYRRLLRTLKELTSTNLFIDTRTEDIETLCFEARRMKEDCDLEILYIDYLQLLSSKSSNDTRANEVQTISRELKKLAMNLNIPVVALVQFNNGILNASLFDAMNYIRESGSIKQDASTIQYVQLEQTEEKKDLKDAKDTVLKNRNGETFVPVQMKYNGPVFSFYEVDDSYV